MIKKNYLDQKTIPIIGIFKYEFESTRMPINK